MEDRELEADNPWGQLRPCSAQHMSCSLVHAHIFSMHGKQQLVLAEAEGRSCQHLLAALQSDDLRGKTGLFSE